MDSQDIIAWGRLRPDKHYSERERIETLCKWGRPLGLDGFFRLEFSLYVDPFAERSFLWGADLL